MTHVEELVQDAVGAYGAELRTGGRHADTDLPGWFYEPTVLSGVEREARIEGEEIFGPVVTVEPFRDEDEALRLANGSSFGLGASVWTRDLARAQRVAPAARRGLGLDERRRVLVRLRPGFVGWDEGAPASAARTASTASTSSSRVKYVDLDRGPRPRAVVVPLRQGCARRGRGRGGAALRRGRYRGTRRARGHTGAGSGGSGGGTFPGRERASRTWTRPARSGWSTSAASPCRGGGRSHGRCCGWRRRRLRGSARCRRVTRSRRRSSRGSWPPSGRAS